MPIPYVQVAHLAEARLEHHLCSKGFGRRVARTSRADKDHVFGIGELAMPGLCEWDGSIDELSYSSVRTC